MLPITDWRMRLSLRSVYLLRTRQHGVARVASRAVLQRADDAIDVAEPIDRPVGDPDGPGGGV